MKNYIFWGFDFQVYPPSNILQAYGFNGFFQTTSNDRCLKSLRLSVNSEPAGVNGQFEDLKAMSGKSISLMLPQGVSVNFRIEAELKDSHSFVIWEYINFTTKTGEGYTSSILIN